MCCAPPVADEVLENLPPPSASLDLPELSFVYVPVSDFSLFVTVNLLRNMLMS